MISNLMLKPVVTTVTLKPFFFSDYKATVWTRFVLLCMV